jgi:hypothetical protein
MSWWRKNWRWLLATVLTSLGFIAVIILILIRKKSEADALRAQIALSKAQAKVDGLEADKAARSKELEANAAKAAVVEVEIIKAKREAVGIVKETKDMDDGAVADAFRDLGY